MPTQTQSTFTSRIAGLAETDADDTHVINGIAVGAGDLTHGLSRKSKLWQADELRAAASTLEGAEIKALHSDAVVGEVTKAAFEPAAGVLYEAELEDEKLAAGIANGRLTVSIEATHFDGGTVETAQGEAMAATNITFDGLAIVQKGAAPSATAEPGEAAALAVMPDEVHAALAGEDDVDLESAAAADVDDLSNSTVVAWQTGNGTLAYGRVLAVIRGDQELGPEHDDEISVSAPAAVIRVYRPTQGGEWTETDVVKARKPGSLRELSNFPAAPQLEAAAAADSREHLTDPPTECRECGDRERTFNTMRCPECHPEMTPEDHPPLATADEETIEDWQEAQAASLADVPYEVTNVAPEDVDEWTDDEWDGDAVEAELPNPSEVDDAADVLDQTMALVPGDEEARASKSSWKAPYRAGVDAPVNTRALVAIDGALSGARGGFDDVSEEAADSLSDWTTSMLSAAPDDLYGVEEAEAAASESEEPGAGDAGSDDPAGASSSSRDADTDADVDEAADQDPESDAAGRDDPAGASSSSRDNDPASDDPDTETAAAAESNQTTDTTTTTSMSDDDDPEDVQELKARLSDKTEQIDTLEEQVDELEEENERLSERAEAVDEAEEAYAEALAAHVPRDAEDLQDDLSLDQLREWLANIDEADLADDVEPSVRSGNDPSGTETANLSEGERERKSQLESKLSEIEDKEGPLAEKEQERLEAELAEITGGDE
jgi:hypothetical protein